MIETRDNGNVGGQDNMAGSCAFTFVLSMNNKKNPPTRLTIVKKASQAEQQEPFQVLVNDACSLAWGPPEPVYMTMLLRAHQKVVGESLTSLPMTRERRASVTSSMHHSGIRFSCAQMRGMRLVSDRKTRCHACVNSMQSPLPQNKLQTHEQ
jgi:hypothetical protein